MAMADGPAAGLALLDALAADGQLDDYRTSTPPAPTCCAGSAGSHGRGRPTARALELTTNEVERAFLARRLAEVEAGAAPAH